MYSSSFHDDGVTVTTITMLRHDVTRAAHIPIPLVFAAFRRLQRPKTSVASVFAASGFARFRKWRTHRYLQGFLGLLCLKRQDMAS